mgnify:CR=1 FL=1
MLKPVAEYDCLVLGCGNPLIGDDGFGPAVIEHLEKNYLLPDSVAAIDCGTSIRDILFDLLLSPQKPRKMIVIDVTDSPDLAPGEIREIDIEQIRPEKIGDFSLHQFPTTNMLNEIKEETPIDVRVFVAQIAGLSRDLALALSAERLRHKLETKLEGADQALLLRAVATIVTQVQAMQTLVNEFRDYARLPAAQMEPLDLNALAGEVLALYGQAQDNGLLLARLEPALPRILGDATQLRQVIHNLVQNALDAVADRPDGQVEIITSVARGENGELHAVRLTVIDNGPGFAEKVLKRAFEPYVTTKARGTGLGLAVVKKIADEHGARLRAANLHAGDQADGPVTGARVSLSFSKFAVTPAGTAGGAGAIPAPVPGDATQVH